jgi:hypothetical protein
LKRPDAVRSEPLDGLQLVKFFRPVERHDNVVRGAGLLGEVCHKALQIVGLGSPCHDDSY